MFDTIIVGHDGTERSQGALEFAVLLARRSHARLVVASAYASPPAVARIASGFDRVTRERAEAVVERLRAQLEDEYRLVSEFHAVAGTSAADALHVLAARKRADLLVVGTDRPALPAPRQPEEVIVGSADGAAGTAGGVVAPHDHPSAAARPGHVAHHLLHGSPCAVAVVPPLRRPRLAHVGVACDGSWAARAALGTALELAELEHSPVRQVDLILIAPDGPRYRLDLKDPGLFVKGPHPVREWLDHVAATQPFGHARVRVVQRSGDPATELSAASAELDLLLMGSHDRGPLRRMVLGSVSSRMAHDARCPVIVSPRRPSAETGEERRVLELRAESVLRARSGVR
jgi:nucleotide-binding universal stress UspA family protein